MFNIFADGQIIYQPGNDALSLISPKLTVEMGKAGSLEFSLPPNNRFYNNLDQIRTKLTVMMDGDEIFRGRVLSNKRSFNNVREVYGEGDLSYLVDSCQQGKKFEGKAHTLFRKIIAEHNRMIQNPEKQFTVGNITVDDYDVILKGQSDDIDVYESTKFKYKQIALNSIAKEWLNTYDYIETALLDYCGGYLRTRYDAATGKTYIDWLKDYYEVSTQTIQFGKNLLDLTEEISAEDLFTVLIPLGDENLTIKDVNNGSVELVDEAAVAKYGRIIKTNVFDGVTKASTLLTNGKRYLKNHVEVPVTYEIKAVDLHLVNPGTRAIFVGDKVHVLSPAHEIDNSDLVCTKIEYDLTNPANTTYTFGNPKQDLTERYRKNRKDDAGRGGGGGAAAAEEVSKDQTDFYKAWIDVKDGEGILDLNTLFKRVYPDEGEIIKSTNQIWMGSNPDGSKIDLISSYRNDLNGVYHAIDNTAKIDIISGENGPQIVLDIQDRANKKQAHINLGSVARERTDIPYIDDNGVLQYKTETSIMSEIDMNAEITKISGDIFQVDTKIADLKADYIELKSVKKTTLQSKILEIVAENLKLSAASGSIKLDAGMITADTINAFDYLLVAGIDINNHAHKISCDSSGTVTSGIVTAWGAAASSSFNIADTQFYKDKVKALTVKSLKTDFTGTYKATCKVYVQAFNADEEELKNKTFTNPYQPSYLTWSRSESGDSYTITVKPVNIGGSYITAPNGSDFPSKTYTNNAYKNVTVNSITNVTHSSAGASFDVNLSNNKTVRKSVFW